MIAPLPDAAPANWVDRLAPPALRPWLRLGRFDRPAGIWLLMLPGWQGIALASAAREQLPSPWLLLAFFLGAALMRAAGCAYNDIVDRDFDAQVARTALRPIPAGEISVKQAWAFVVGCSLTSLLILLTLGTTAIVLGVMSLGLVAGYPFMKRITWWPQAWLGLTFNWGALLGYAAVTGMVEPPALLLYAAGIFWTLGYDTIYALQDIEDDALAGVKSSARRLGKGVRKGVLGFYVLTALLAVAAAWSAALGPIAFTPIWAVFAAHLLAQGVLLKPDQPQHALKLFKSNAWAGLILFVALAAGMFRNS
ncbi:MAG: 4-hydroxybenzoate octaprenyltransferase [Caulobacter sp.]